MTIEPTAIDGLLIIRPQRFGDDRGYFAETFRATNLGKHPPHFVQDNESKSRKAVLRGLHFQAPPHAQGKLVSVVAGSVYDVVLDIRKNSPTYGQWHGEVLSADNMTRLWIPEGFAHGFLTLEDDSLFQYKCSAYYDKESEGCIAYDDAMLAVDWKGAWDRHGSGDFTPLVSEKDKDGSAFASFQSPFHS